MGDLSSVNIFFLLNIIFPDPPPSLPSQRNGSLPASVPAQSRRPCPSAISCGGYSNIKCAKQLCKPCCLSRPPACTYLQHQPTRTVGGTCKIAILNYLFLCSTSINSIAQPGNLLRHLAQNSTSAVQTPELPLVANSGIPKPGTPPIGGGASSATEIVMSQHRQVNRFSISTPLNNEWLNLIPTSSRPHAQLDARHRQASIDVLNRQEAAHNVTTIYWAEVGSLHL